MAKHKMTREEKFVELLINYMSDLRLDLDMVGFYFLQMARNVDLLRLETIYTSIGKHTQENKNRDEHYAEIYKMGE